VARSADSNVWFSYNNGNAFQVGYTNTENLPTVVPWGNGNLAVFNVGTDHKVYWTFIQNGYPGNPASWNPWTQLTPIGGVQTDLPVAVTQQGENSNHLYMVWRGNGSDTQVYGSYFNGGGWGPVETLQGATNSQPSITFNAFSEAIWV
jgi:hypothetical protein